jgi:hypothetical protein
VNCPVRFLCEKFSGIFDFNFREMWRWLKLVLPLFLLLIALATSPSVGAQTDPPTDPCEVPQNPDEPPVYCPIDGGLAFLLLAGVGYGVGKYRSSERTRES